MQTILLNEQPYQTKASTLAALATELQLPAASAVIYQGHVIPRALWDRTALTSAAKVSFFNLVAGG
jgi:thiamine biosynthesis protein ThiS